MKDASVAVPREFPDFSQQIIEGDFQCVQAG